MLSLVPCVHLQLIEHVLKPPLGCRQAILGHSILNLYPAPDPSPFPDDILGYVALLVLSGLLLEHLV